MRIASSQATDDTNIMFCEVDVPQNLVDHLQKIADYVVCNYILIRMNATPQEYVQYIKANHPCNPIFLVYTASELFMCYGVTDEESTGVPMALDFLATYSKDRKLGYEGYGDYLGWFRDYPHPITR